MTTTTSPLKWTAPFHGVSHFGKFGTANRWATVEDHGLFVVLLKWFPGCGFNPEKSDFPNVRAAQRTGEAFVNGSHN